MVLPAAPLLMPDLAQTVPDGVAEVLAACDEVLSAGLASASEVVIVSAPDQTRDLDGSGRPPRALAADVADALLDRVGYSGVRVHVDPQERERDAVTWLFMADGSASVGAKAPRPGVAGEHLDESLIQALSEGALGELRAIGDGEAMAAGCLTAPVWRRLGELAGPTATCEAMSTFAPFGVRYFVGSWTTEADTR